MLATAAFATLLAIAPTLSHAETYTLDSSHTNIDWRISHFGFSSPSGKFTKAEGTLVLDEKDPSKSSVKVTLSPTNVITGIEKLDEHLKGKDFFNVAEFPDASFVSTAVKVTGKDTALVTGNLTVHGVTKPVTLKTKLNKIAVNMFNKKTAGFSATTTIKRSDFGIVTYLPNLGDEVEIHIEVEANLAQ